MKMTIEFRPAGLEQNPLSVIHMTAEGVQMYPTHITVREGDKKYHYALASVLRVIEESELAAAAIQEDRQKAIDAFKHVCKTGTQEAGTVTLSFSGR